MGKNIDGNSNHLKNIACTVPSKEKERRDLALLDRKKTPEDAARVHVL